MIRISWKAKQVYCLTKLVTLLPRYTFRSTEHRVQFPGRETSPNPAITGPTPAILLAPGPAYYRVIVTSRIGTRRDSGQRITGLLSSC